jgi:hypothetical protein
MNQVERACEFLFQPAVNLKKLTRRYRRFHASVHAHIRPHLRHDPTRLDLTWFKRSDRLFVLGSGASINQFTPEQWQIIGQHDSMALSFWLYHDFVPTYFFFEVPKLLDHTRVLFQLLQLRASDYARTPVIMNDLSQADERFPAWHDELPIARFPRFYALHNIGLPGASISRFEQWLRLYLLLGVFRRRASLWYLPKKRASLSMAIAFALMAGYRQIIFCGVDLNRTGYFYEAPQFRSKGLPMIEPPPPAAPALHSTAAKTARGLPIDEVILAMRRVLLARRQVELFVALSSSGLYPRLPCFFPAQEPAPAEPKAQ